jgi:type II secretory pathway predicted ATPase ExeA
MVNDGRNPYTKLGKYLQQSMGGSTDTATNIEDIIKRLKARGGREQMLMFLTGPAGSGKSTAVMVAQHFCYEFCLAVGAMWSDTTFYSLLTQERQHHCLVVLQSRVPPSSISANH